MGKLKAYSAIKHILISNKWNFNNLESKTWAILKLLSDISDNSNKRGP